MSREANLTDPDNPEWTKADFARARPASEVLTPAQMAQFKRAPGRPKLEKPKVPVSLRLDPDVLNFFKASGPGWQTRLEDVLRGAMGKGPVVRGG
ncbi:BrnA antitoxin family protein [soil metagenome]